MLMVYVTTKNLEEAEFLGQSMVERRLAAGVNIVQGVHSIFHWKGEIHNTQECLCLFITHQARFEELKSALLELHSYETPCIMGFSMQEVEEQFAAWIAEETGLGTEKI